MITKEIRKIDSNIENKWIKKKINGLSYIQSGNSVSNVLLMLHGIPGSSSIWKNVANLLLENYTILIPDLKGFGDSDSPKNDFYIEFHAFHSHFHQIIISPLRWGK